MIDSCRLRNPAAGLRATYCKPIAFKTSAMKSDPGRVMNVSLGSFAAADLASGLDVSAASVACASFAPAASAVPATAAVLFRNDRRAALRSLSSATGPPACGSVRKRIPAYARTTNGSSIDFAVANAPGRLDRNRHRFEGRVTIDEVDPLVSDQPSRILIAKSVNLAPGKDPLPIE